MSKAPPRVPAPEPLPPAPQVPAEPPPESAFEIATRRELEQLRKLDSMAGQQVLIIARRMANGTETGSAMATLSKEHSRLMAALGRNGSEQGDEVDEVSRRRAEKRNRARSTAS